MTDTSGTPSIAPCRITVIAIQDAVSEYYNLKKDDLVGPCRKRDLARPRQIGMFLCTELTKRSLPDIGRRFGGRDHTTVLHAKRRIQEFADTPLGMDKEADKIQHAIAELRSKLTGIPLTAPPPLPFPPCP